MGVTPIISVLINNGVERHGLAGISLKPWGPLWITAPTATWVAALPPGFDPRGISVYCDGWGKKMVGEKQA